MKNDKAGRDINIPAVFRGAREYKEDPVALELAQATFNEEALYCAIADAAKDWYAVNKKPARILDLCAATGLAAYRVALSIPVSECTLVDIDSIGLTAGITHFDKVCACVLLNADAVDSAYDSDFDLVLLNSAYHHIEDARKVAFLRKAKEAAGPASRLILGEHFLPPYSSDIASYRRAVTSFYETLVDELYKRGTSEDVIAILRRVGLYGWNREFEFKVSWEAFRSDVQDAGLEIQSVVPMWEVPSLGANVGSYCVVLKCSTRLPVEG